MKRTLWAAALASLLATGCPAESADSGTTGGDATTDAGGTDSGMISTASPSKRSDSLGVSDPATNTLLIFGGDDGPIVNQTPMAAYRNDTWVFEPGVGWTEITPSTGPSVRGRHAFAHDPNAGRALLFGGRWRATGMSGNYTLFADTWAFDFATRDWSLVHDGVAGAHPAPRYFAAAAYDPGTDELWIWGGGSNTSALNLQVATDAWKYDGATWQMVPTTGTAPSPARMFTAYAYDSSRNRLVVFGGQVGDFVSAGLNDLYALDLTTATWSMLDGGTGPNGRFSSVMTYDVLGDRYLVFGGHADLLAKNDIWAFDPNANVWSLLNAGDALGPNFNLGCMVGAMFNPQEIPADFVTQDLSTPERRTGGAFAILGNDLWLFGGESDCSDHLDDTWSFNIVTSVWTEVIEANSGESCLRRGDACMCLCL